MSSIQSFLCYEASWTQTLWQHISNASRLRRLLFGGSFGFSVKADQLEAVVAAERQREAAVKKPLPMNYHQIVMKRGSWPWKPIRIFGAATVSCATCCVSVGKKYQRQRRAEIEREWQIENLWKLLRPKNKIKATCPQMRRTTLQWASTRQICRGELVGKMRIRRQRRQRRWRWGRGRGRGGERVEMHTTELFLWQRRGDVAAHAQQPSSISIKGSTMRREVADRQGDRQTD